MFCIFCLSVDLQYIKMPDEVIQWMSPALSNCKHGIKAWDPKTARHSLHFLGLQPIICIFFFEGVGDTVWRLGWCHVKGPEMLVYSQQGKAIEVEKCSVLFSVHQAACFDGVNAASSGWGKKEMRPHQCLKSTFPGRMSPKIGGNMANCWIVCVPIPDSTEFNWIQLDSLCLCQNDFWSS